MGKTGFRTGVSPRVAVRKYASNPLNAATRALLGDASALRRRWRDTGADFRQVKGFDDIIIGPKLSPVDRGPAPERGPSCMIDNRALVSTRGTVHQVSRSESAGTGRQGNVGGGSPKGRLERAGARTRRVQARFSSASASACEFFGIHPPVLGDKGACHGRHFYFGQSCGRSAASNGLRTRVCEGWLLENGRLGRQLRSSKHQWRASE